MQLKSKTCLEKFVLFGSDQHSGWSYCSCWTKIFKTMGKIRFVELFNPKLFHAYKKIQILMKAFSTFNKNLLDLDRLKCKLRSVYAADFEKQVSSIQEVTEIIWELEWNQVLAEVTKLLCLILTIPAISASFKRLSSSLKHINNYMRSS